MKRTFVVVIDSLGVGYEEKSKDYGDEGANTLAHIFEVTEGKYKIPNLQKMGLCNLVDVKGNPKIDNPSAYYGKLKESDIWNSMYAQAHGQLTLAQQLSQEQEYNSKIQGYSDSITANAGKFSFINKFKDDADTLFANGSISKAEHDNRIEAYKEAKKAMVDKILNNSADLSGYETMAQYEELTKGVDKSENYADSNEAISIKNAAKSANDLMDVYNSTPYFKHKGELSHITSNSSNNRVRTITLENSGEFDSPTGELAYQKRVDEATKSGNFKLPKWLVGGPGFHGGPGGPPPGGPPPGGPPPGGPRR